MKDRVYIDGYLKPKATARMVRKAVAKGKCVVLVDGVGVAVEITRKNLKP